MPKLDEVKARVRDDVVKQKAVETARQKAAAIAAQLKARRLRRPRPRPPASRQDDRARSRAARRLPDVGVSPAIDAVAFALPAGGVSDPIATDNGAVIVKVLEHDGRPTPDELKTGRDAFRDRAAQRAPQPLLQRLHDQGERADEHQRQPQVTAQVIG